jgi:hypothetical protein
MSFDLIPEDKEQSYRYDCGGNIKLYEVNDVMAWECDN